MKIRVIYITGQLPNLPWWRSFHMTREEIDTYNNQFLSRETVDFGGDADQGAGVTE